MDTQQGNLFTILTLIAAPAILTNATSVLALNTANRFGRVIDRSRQLTDELQVGIADEDRKARRARQVERLGRRGVLLIRAQTRLYTALGLFVSTALISVIGAVLAAHNSPGAEALGLIGLVVGFAAAGSLLWACVLIVRETRLAVQNLTEEAALLAPLVRASAAQR